MTEKQVEAKVEEKVEDSEPTPYRNDYHKDLDKEDPQPDPKAVEAEATQKEEDKSFLSTSKAQTLPIMVSAQITQDRGILWWNMCVVIIIMIIPVITMAFFLQKFITKGVLLGAVKG